jgi:septal ring factor EnvC (AmiA/AmiB activator)
MQRGALVLAVCLLPWVAVWADPPSSSTATGSPAQAHVNQRISQRQAEVDHLQQDVGQQESASRQAADRLQQQDRTIAELRQQLKAAQQAANAPPAAGH